MAEDAVDSDGGEPRLLGQVEVTATRREQAQHLVPASVFVIDGSALEDRGDRSLGDIAADVPGLSYSGGNLGGAPPVAILRGVGGNIEYAEDNPLVAVYFGETPVTHPGGNGFDANPRMEWVDLDRVEVLRGPQGTYFGVGAMGGALRFLPRRPEPGLESARWAGDVSGIAHGGIGFGSQATVNRSIDDRQALRASAWMRRQGGYIDDVDRGEKDVNTGESGGARAAYRFMPDAAFTLDATLWTQFDRTDADPFREYADPSLSQSRAIDERHDERWVLGQVDADYRGERGHWILNLSAFDRDYVQRIDVTTFNDAVFGIDLPLTARNDNAVRENTQELRWLLGEDNDLGAMIGLFRQDRRFDFDQDFPSPGITAQIPDIADFGIGDSLARIRTLTRLEQSAIYASTWWRFRPDWELTAGLRGLRESRSFDAENTGIFGNAPVNLRASDSGLTPHLALRHEWRDGVQVYAAATRGFRGGRMTDPTGSQLPECAVELAALGLDAFPIEVGPDHLWNYELGSKLQVGDGRGWINAAVYHIDWDDIQTARVLECAGITLVTNEGKARSEGIEFDLWMVLDERWEAQAALAYSDAEFTSGLLSGQRVPGVPHFSGSAHLGFAPRPGGPRFELGYAHVGRSNQAFSGGSRTEIGGYGLLTLGLVQDFGGWEAALRVHNALDRKGRIGASDHFLLSAEIPVAPRTVVLSASITF